MENEINTSFKVEYTNGYTERVNNKIKVLKQNAYGIRNFKKLRAAFFIRWDSFSCTPF